MLLETAGPWRKVAVLRPGRIGDYLCATPAVRALRQAVPHAELHYVALPLVRDLVERNPCVDRFVAFPGFPYIAEQFFRPRRAVRWLSAMQDEEYDLVVQLYGSGVYANPIALLMGGRCCAGFVRTDAEPHPLDAAVPLPQAGPEVDRALALVRHLGAPDAGREYDLRLDAADRAGAARLLDRLARPVIGLHGGARDGERAVEVAAFARAAELLGGSAVLLGGVDQPSVAGALNLTGRLPLAAAAAVIAGLDALLTTDSGPAHLAYALGTPSVTVFVASDPRRWGPPVPGPHAVLDCRARPVTAEAVAAAVPTRAGMPGPPAPGGGRPRPAAGRAW
ncbi:MAG: glycosyltransferase family 9 protein [Micromonosporaceae bacterium]|jgi:ADP-heptose:LPS heptosyltransferase|nr:glycosyltransferase family 9 protein [Micromonosporaceae bacterium]